MVFKIKMKPVDCGFAIYTKKWMIQMDKFILSSYMSSYIPDQCFTLFKEAEIRNRDLEKFTKVMMS